MMFDYDRKPVNKTAAIVASQSRCATDDTLTNEQKRENLVTKLKALEAELLSHPKGSAKRKELGAYKAKLTSQVNALRPKMRCKDVKDHILDVMREELTEFQFKRILHLASLRAESA